MQLMMNKTTSDFKPDCLKDKFQISDWGKSILIILICNLQVVICNSQEVVTDLTVNPLIAKKYQQLITEK